MYRDDIHKKRRVIIIVVITIHSDPLILFYTKTQLYSVIYHYWNELLLATDKKGDVRLIIIRREQTEQNEELIIKERTFISL